MKAQKGFAVLESLLVLIIIAIIGGTGYFVWHSKAQTDMNLDNASSLSLVGKRSNVNSLKTYNDSTGTFSIKYPANAKINAQVDENTKTISSATITFKDGSKLSVSNGVGGRGIPYNCSYDEATGKTTWDGPSSGQCPYMVVSDAQKLSATGYDENGKLQNVYLVDNNYTTQEENSQVSTIKDSCLVLGPTADIGKKVYGMQFVDQALSTYKKGSTGLQSFIYGCTVKGSGTNYFSSPEIKEAKAVLASFSFN
jgi:type II secretory pathway pseudopilin PulG